MPGVGVELAVGQFQNARGDPVEEIAVVGDEQAGPAVASQEVLQPFDGDGVEMVGRLVEDQQLRPRQEGPGEGDATFLTAGKATGGAVRIRRADVAEEFLHAAFEVPTVEPGDMVEQVTGAVALGGLIFVFFDQVEDATGPGEDVFPDGENVVQGEVLRQEPGDEFPAAGEVPTIRLGDAGGEA